MQFVMFPMNIVHRNNNRINFTIYHFLLLEINLNICKMSFSDLENYRNFVRPKKWGQKNDERRVRKRN